MFTKERQKRTNYTVKNVETVAAGKDVQARVFTEMTVYVVRAFVELRRVLSSNKDLARKLEALERSLVRLDLKTQRQFKEVYKAIRALMSEPAPTRRGIGFTADLEPENR